ncbi:MAG: aspartate kinase [Bacteroidetes bacterium GWF2_38_335]|nr:MAG: aspartate kinase [Bacteroidetes bacterium GWF2_38_335]OFY76923.1 MAG: aspartate kinase [Bacteroidetes bacterium RIFOXYA12_FULL_38_20]HBS86772.1 aspartate kinase [Bacteroidales bacterium]
MIVYKFGGASVKNSDSVKNLAEIVKTSQKNLVVVVSAMGKTTNALENVLEDYFNGNDGFENKIEGIKNYHLDIARGLFPDNSNAVFDLINSWFARLNDFCRKGSSLNFDYEYDQVVSYGELVSTEIVSAFLNECSLKSKWVDIRTCFKTDNLFRDATVNMEITGNLVKDSFPDENKIYVTQGFIGSTIENLSTTLGREGSDFSAAILANILEAESLTIWKDVPGILNADPKWFDETVKLNHISYLEAIELAYYGATIIHPKTIKPLQNKGIPLFVRSFLDPSETGTVINTVTSEDSRVPSFIFRMNQVLISIKPRDFSFIMENALSEIFGKFAGHRVKINLMQNSAISFSVSVDNDDRKVPALIKDLQKHYQVLYNDGLELVTIRHFDQSTIDRVTVGKKILVEQKSRSTARFIMKDM